MTQDIKANVMEALSHHALAIDEMTVKTQEAFFSAISQIEKLGIDNFAYTTIDKNGHASQFTTSSVWKNILSKADTHFFKLMQQHVNFEVLHVMENKLRFVTRSKDILTTPYLQTIDSMGLNSSILFYQFSKNKIEIFYYLFSNTEFKNIILNNIDFLNLLIPNLQKPLETISSPGEIITSLNVALSKNTLEKIWHQSNLGNRKKIPFILNNQNILLSTRETQCLAFLRHGCSTKYMSEKLNISELTIRDHILNLREKFEAEDRSSLIKIAQNKSFRKLESIIHNL